MMPCTRATNAERAVGLPPKARSRTPRRTRRSSSTSESVSENANGRRDQPGAARSRNLGHTTRQWPSAGRAVDAGGAVAVRHAARITHWPFTLLAGVHAIGVDGTVETWRQSGWQMPMSQKSAGLAQSASAAQSGGSSHGDTGVAGVGQSALKETDRRRGRVAPASPRRTSRCRSRRWWRRAGGRCRPAGRRRRTRRRSRRPGSGPRWSRRCTPSQQVSPAAQSASLVQPGEADRVEQHARRAVVADEAFTPSQCSRRRSRSSPTRRSRRSPRRGNQGGRALGVAGAAERDAGAAVVADVAGAHRVVRAGAASAHTPVHSSQ